MKDANAWYHLTLHHLDARLVFLTRSDEWSVDRWEESGCFR